MCTFQHPPWKKNLHFLFYIQLFINYSLFYKIWWYDDGCWIVSLNVWCLIMWIWFCLHWRVDAWTIFKHWLFDFLEKSWVGTWSFVIVVKAENLNKLELLNFNFDKKIRSKGVYVQYVKESVGKGLYFSPLKSKASKMAMVILIVKVLVNMTISHS